MGKLIAVAAIALISCGPIPGDGGSDTPDAGDIASPTDVQRTGLVAYSGSERIGVVLDATEYLLRIWDTESGLLFWLNDQTGFVGGQGFDSISPWQTEYFKTNDCSGDVYYSLAESACEAQGDRPRSEVKLAAGDGNTEGWAEAATLYVAAQPTWITSNSRDSGSYCDKSYYNRVCVTSFALTTAIPTAFELPIKIVEE